LLQIYDGTAKAVSVTTTPPGLAVIVTYNGLPDAPTNVGSYTVIGTVSDLNYQGGATDTLVIMPPGGCISAPSGMIAWWPGDDNANDLAGTNNGTLGGGALFATGEVENAFSFDGVNDIVNLHGPNLNGNASYTLMFWAKPFSYVQDSALVCFGANGLASGTICVSMWSGGTKVTVNHYGNDHIFGQSWLPNQWQHVAVVYDSSTGVESLYFNGSFSESWNPAPLTLNSSRLMTFGRWVWGGQYYSGLLDEVQFFNRTLSSSEVQAVYLAGGAGLCRPAVPPRLATPVRLGDGSVQLAFANSSGASFSVLGTTNVALHPSNWTVLGVAMEVSPGQFQFTDTQATNNPRQFYRVRSP
jgi:hypothetical protein